MFVGDRLQTFGGPRKAIALLAYLLLHRRRSLSRAAVAEQFWPDYDDASARAALRRHLHRALAALPPAPPAHLWILADKTSLRWDPQAPLELDMDEYERLSNAGERAAAVALYRGDYLEDFYEDWILNERERLRDLHAANLTALIDEHRRALDYPNAIAYAQALLRMDSLREDAVRRLMTLRFAAGDRSGALADFASFGRRLREELDAAPMPETTALHEAIRRNELQAIEPSAPSEDARAAGFPFVGRQEALRTLRRTWEAAARGRGTTVLISGEAGIGKTRLIGELIALAESQGARIAIGNTAATASEPYQPVAEALNGALPLVRVDEVEPIKLAALSALLPEIREYVPGLAPPPHLDSERERLRLFDAIRSVFANVATPRPLLLAFEDIHWAGPATIELLEFLVRRLKGSAVLVVISVREESFDGDPVVRAFLRRLDPQHSQHIGLGPLDFADVRSLSGAITGDPDELARELMTRSGGHPLFLTEVIRERLAGTALERVPAGIDEMVRARVGRLSQRARTMLETAAVAGTGFDSDVVRRVLGWSFAEAFDALDELLDRALVRESFGGRGEFIFAHQLVHEAIYEALSAGERERLHRRLGRTLHRLFPDSPALYVSIAGHFDRAGLSEEAVGQYLLASGHALAVFSNEEAARLASRGLELATDLRVRFTLLRTREEAVARLGDVSTREADCRAMCALAVELDDAELRGFALSRSIQSAMLLGKRDEEAKSIDALRELSRETASARWSIEATLAQARLAYNVGDRAGAEDILADAEALAETIADNRVLVTYWSLRAWVASEHSVDRGRVFLDKARSHLGVDRALQIELLRHACNIADREGNPAELRRLATELLESYAEIGDLHGQGSAHQHLHISKWYSFEFAEANEHARLALDAFNRIGKRGSIAGTLLDRGVRMQHVGAFDAAEADYRQAQEIALEIELRGVEGLAAANLSSLATFRGDYTTALTLAAEALTFGRGYGLDDVVVVALESRGIAERELGNAAAARVALEEALTVRRSMDPRGVLETLIELIPVYLALSEIEFAVACAEELLRALEPDRRRASFPVYALGAAASALSAAGEVERAEALDREAAALLETILARMPDEASRIGYRSLPFHRSRGRRGFGGTPAEDGRETVAG